MVQCQKAFKEADDLLYGRANRENDPENREPDPSNTSNQQQNRSNNSVPATNGAKKPDQF